MEPISSSEEPHEQLQTVQSNAHQKYSSTLWGIYMDKFKDLENYVFSRLFNKYLIQPSLKDDIRKYSGMDDVSGLDYETIVNIENCKNRYMTSYDEFMDQVILLKKSARITEFEEVNNEREKLCSASLEYNQHLENRGIGMTNNGYIDEVRCYYIIKRGNKQHGIRRCSNKVYDLDTRNKIKEHIKSIKDIPDTVYNNRCGIHSGVEFRKNPLLNKWLELLKFCETIDSGEDIYTDEKLEKIVKKKD
jgi:hypothetical protein